MSGLDVTPIHICHVCVCVCVCVCVLYDVCVFVCVCVCVCVCSIYIYIYIYIYMLCVCIVYSICIRTFAMAGQTLTTVLLLNYLLPTLLPGQRCYSHTVCRL
jgi:hypothetical protein